MPAKGRCTYLYIPALLLRWHTPVLKTFLELLNTKRMKNLLGTITALLLAVVVHAQVTVKGTVKNNDEAPLPGATITITSGSRQLSTTSNANGLFTISNVPENTNAVVTATYV